MKTLLTISTLFCLLSVQVFAQNPQPTYASHDKSIDDFIKASKYLKAQQYAEASLFLDKAIAKDPKNHVFYYERGRCYLNLKNYDKAIHCFKTVANLQPNSSEAHLMLGYIYANIGKNKEAIAEYDMAFKHETSPDNRLAQKLSIITLMDKNGELHHADKHIEDAKNLGIEAPLLYYYEGKNKNIHKKYKSAKESLLKAIHYISNKHVASNTSPNTETHNHNDGFTTASYTASAENLALKSLSEMQETKIMKQTTASDQAKYYYELYYAYYHLNQYDEAQKLIAYIDAAPYKAKIKTMNTNYLYAVAYAHFKVYDLDKCKHVLEDILKKDKHNRPAQNLFVKLAELQTDKTQLIKQLENAIAHINHGKHKDKLQHELLTLEVENGEYDKAITVADEIILSKPDDHNALFLKAIALDKKGEDKAAMNILQQLVSFRNLDEKTLSEYEFELGLIAEKMNDINLATDAFKHTTYMYFKAAAIEELKNVEQLRHSAKAK
jgi:tetratricopeptide (TPR) repeat protein